MLQGLIMALQSALSLGVLWGILALGVYLSFRVLNMADMTVEGSFALGASVGAVLITVHEVNPWVVLLAALVAGMMAGAVTGLLHTKLGIPSILAGILTMIALYSINIRIMGKANISLLGSNTIFAQLQSFGISPNTAALVAGVALTALLILALTLFFRTEVGYTVRATGCNEKMVRAQGASTDSAKILGLMLANGLAALAGALASQQQGYAKVDMGSGAIVIGLASVIIGEALLGKRVSLPLRLVGMSIGSVLYRVAIGLILQLGPSWFQSTDLKLFTAILVGVALSLPTLKEKSLRLRRRKAVQPVPLGERSKSPC